MPELEQIWTELSVDSGHTHGQGFVLRLLGAGSGCRVFASVRIPQRQRSLIVAVSREALLTTGSLPATPAFTCMIADLPGLLPGEAGLILVLERAEYVDLFTHLGEDVRLAAVAAPDANCSVSAVIRCIDRWRRFVQKHGTGRLSDEEVRGLLGEMAVLARLVQKLGPRSAVSCWKGPTGSLRDFEMPACSVEVKSYQSDTGASLWINDPEQLDEDGARPVYVTSVRLAESPSGGRSLPAWVQELRSLITGDEEALDLFTDRLAEAGYLDAHSSSYGSKHYVVEAASLYRVGSGFPRIHPNAVPAGVDRVRFSIRLAALGPWKDDMTDICGQATEIWGHNE